MSISSSRGRCSQFSIKEIKEATNQFDSRQILGQGGEAKVYYAEIYIGSKKTPVAVKHLKENSKEFESEIHIVSKIQHPNLVSLLGYCNESGHKILVYEYMAKGCLSDYLKKKAKISLPWLQRLNICLGAARGLQHLHIETDENPKGIIHRDVKPGNILVGENWVGKLSDFGLFKLSNAGQDKSLMTTNLKGTSGYYAPEYIKNRRITRKIDVYAFGVVLFEVLCRKMPWDREDESYYADEDEDLGFWAQQNVDPQIQGEVSRDSLKVYADIIGTSLHAHPGRRPTMERVVMDLQKALECQDSEKLEKEVEPPRRRSRRLPDPPRGPTMDSVVMDLQKALECQDSENLEKEVEPPRRRSRRLPDPPRGLEGMTSKVKGHTLEEVSKHNKSNDCWIIIAGKIYDVTPFLEDHPGGDDVLLAAAGKDATDDFEDVGHPSSAREMMERYYVGKINVGYTFEEVSKHNMKNDCWIIISGKVYDVTPFLEDHPGGDEVLLAVTGKDATDDFEDVGHPSSAREMMERYYLGDIDVSTIPPRPKLIQKNQNTWFDNMKNLF